MAKKKKGKGRRKPPASRPPTTPRRKPAEASGEASTADELAKATAPGKDRERRKILEERRHARRRRGRIRNVGIAVLVILAIVGAVFFNQFRVRRAIASHNAMAAEAAACSTVDRHRGLSRDHVATAVEYPQSPPVGGAHAAGLVPAGVYSEPFSTNPTETPNIYQAVHSLEHGYVVVWHDGLEEDELTALEQAFATEHKVIVVPYPDLAEGQQMALTGWGWSQHCEEADEEVARSFVDLFREANTAPEPEGA